MRKPGAYTRLSEQISQSPTGSISFRMFMETALYDPHVGYYCQEKTKVGKGGDFYTSVSVGSVYGETLAHVIADMLHNLPVDRMCSIVEMGGGSGSLGAAVLGALKAKGVFHNRRIRYVMIEVSPYHRNLQQEALSAFSEEVEVCWYDTIAGAKEAIPELCGILLSNELPDAFPVHLVEWRNNEWQEVHVALEVDGRFVERLLPLVDKDVIAYIQRERIPALNGYRTEVNVEAISWMKEAASWLTCGYMLTVDYGYRREQLYTPSRRMGTLLCYREHTVADNPYEHPGEADITSHVNFSALMDTGEEAGLTMLSFSSQRDFLMAAGILTLLQEHSGGDPFRNPAAKRNRAIMQLIAENGMGHAFCVLVQGKGVKAPSYLQGKA
ncbi:class I SAM-dependent methyltransferase [Aneurinibacillus uraniidurans]|uniref:class I SAM-dependent methyltransferase n=1 Tax=Aneurinibacillus uraniidurans TaxID=2966586 RepID=UPI00234B8556|nr:SAM-dependent methyltransferase [Aneurinibacillus sp. B1]WCN38972.1 SAM-dependent methyltransferase [Aneurinibacillus sp. B1]